MSDKIAYEIFEIVNEDNELFFVLEFIIPKTFSVTTKFLDSIKNSPHIYNIGRMESSMSYYRLAIKFKSKDDLLLFKLTELEDCINIT